jgi:hypothetical protein
VLPWSRKGSFPSGESYMNDEIINCAPPKEALLIEMNSKS